MRAGRSRGFGTSSRMFSDAFGDGYKGWKFQSQIEGEKKSPLFRRKEFLSIFLFDVMYVNI
jgi:hypothetical protein